jgi:hypothetical protein
MTWHGPLGPDEIRPEVGRVDAELAPDVSGRQLAAVDLAVSLLDRVWADDVARRDHAAVVLSGRVVRD